MKFKISEAWLRKHYMDLDMTYQQCADIIGCHYQTIRAHARKYGIYKTKWAKAHRRILNPETKKNITKHYNEKLKEVWG